VSVENAKKVSFIMPVYNAADYLRQNVDSILNQDYQNIEVILVDDGSSDDSAIIIKEYMKNDDRVVGLFQENSGAPAARNKGMDYATGDYIQFVDSDDYLADNVLRKMVEAAEQTEADIVMGWYDTVNEAGEFGKTVTLPVEAGTYNGPELRETFSLATSVPGNKLLSAKMVKENEIYFADLRQAQDLNYYLRLLLFAQKITVLDTVVYHYRVRSGSISHSYSLVILETIKSIEDAEAFYKERNAYDSHLFTNLKFKHYTFQLQKVPQIKNKADRKQAFAAFKQEFKRLDSSLLLPQFKGKALLINRLKLVLSPVYNSDLYTNYQTKKAKKNVVS
jgi:glycosyltransferase involved in cell wall biosynthesis